MPARSCSPRPTSSRSTRSPADPDAEVIDYGDAEEVTAPGLEEIYLRGSGVPSPPDGSTYRLWAISPSGGATYIGDFVPVAGAILLGIAIDPNAVESLLDHARAGRLGSGRRPDSPRPGRPRAKSTRRPPRRRHPARPPASRHAGTPRTSRRSRPRASAMNPVTWPKAANAEPPATIVAPITISSVPTKRSFNSGRPRIRHADHSAPRDQDEERRVGEQLRQPVRGRTVAEHLLARGQPLRQRDRIERAPGAARRT